MISTIFLESKKYNPFYNLALEELAFERVDKNECCFILWRNEPSVIVGRYQNTIGEINAEFIKNNNIYVARRLSGGGAMFQDLGNINYTIIKAFNEDKVSFNEINNPVVEALRQMGVPAEKNGRNDVIVNGKKVSGNSAYLRDGKIMHHGTLLFDCNLYMLEWALSPPKEKYLSKGISSVSARVRNIKEVIPHCISSERFIEALKNELGLATHAKEYNLTNEENSRVVELAQTKYNTWDWIYGKSPQYNVERSKKIDGVGTIKAALNVVDGIINNVHFSGDFFGDKNTDDVSKLLEGKKCHKETVLNCLRLVRLDDYFRGATENNICDLIVK